MTEGHLAEGYRRRAEQARQVAREMDAVSREAAEELGDAPDW